MAKKPLRSQLNQIRAWVREGRTDAWIAHQLELPTAELREFRRRHSLEADGEDSGEIDLRDEIEAEIEATMDEEEEEDEDEAQEEAEDEAEEDDAGDADGDRAASRGDGDGGGGDSGEGQGKRRRRRRRGGRGRGRGRAGAGMQATFDHGEKDGYGLWLDPAVKDDPVYSEHWAGHRPVEVTVEADRIVIKRSENQSR